MDFNDIVSKRRSIRKYKDIPVSKEQINSLLQAAIMAPSGKNKQPWHFVVVAGKKKTDILETMKVGIQREIDGEGLLSESRWGLADAMNTMRIMKQASVIIFVFDEEFTSPFQEIGPDRHVTELVNTLSIGAAVENMILKATQIGLGTLWIGNTFYAYRELRKILQTDRQLLGAVAVGIANEDPQPRPRKSVEEVTTYYF